MNHDTSAESGDLLVAAAAGDSDAFGRFYDLHVRTVLAWFYRRTACPETAADLTAETFAAALTSLASFSTSKGGGDQWLFGIARNTFRRYARWYHRDTRARQRLGIMTKVALDDESYDRIEQLVDFEPVKARMREGLDGLSGRVRAAVDLRVVEELPFAEVAARLGCSSTAARARVSRGLHQLKTELKEPI